MPGGEEVVGIQVEVTGAKEGAADIAGLNAEMAATEARNKALGASADDASARG